MTTGPHVVLRRFRWWDLTEVVRLERELFPDDPWSVGVFVSELADVRGRRYRVAVEAGGAPEGADGGRAGTIVGYAGLHTFADEAYVNTIAVRRDRWGQGVGSLLLDDLLSEAERRGAQYVGLEVAAANVAAQRLYASRGFEAVGLRPRYYQATGEDAVVMVRPGGAEAPAPGGRRA